jgi:hypothetical protein
LCETEAGDQLSIHFIGLGPRQLYPGLGFRGCWIDKTYQLASIKLASIKEVSGECFRVGDGSFQTGMNLADIILDEPVGKLSEARLSVSKDAMPETTVFADQADVELHFSDINA